MSPDVFPLAKVGGERTAYVFPALAPTNPANAHNMLIVSDSKRFHGVIAESDSDDVRFSQVGLRSSLAASDEPHSDGVGFMLGVGQVLKIARAVMQAIPVYVIGLHVGKTWTDEGSSDEGMDTPGELSALPSQLNVQAPVGVHRRLEDAPGIIPLRMVLAPYSSPIRYGVQSFETNDRPPFLGGDSGRLIVHRGLLRGVTPPAASTLRGGIRLPNFTICGGHS